MSADAIHCSVITPERQVVDTTATSVIIPAHDGQIGILPGRAPLLCKLGIGVLKMETTGEGTKELYVDGGFAQVLNDNVIVLTERAAEGKDISKADAEKSLAAAESMPAHTEDEVAARQLAIERAKTRIKVAQN